MIGYMDRTAGAVEHCETMAANSQGVVAEAYEKLVDYCKRKLWHQLTMLILEMFQNPQTYAMQTPNDGTHSFLALYDKVVLSVDTKLNPLYLAKIAALVAQAIQPQDATAAKAILENLLANKKKEKAEGNENSGNNNNSANTFTLPATIYVQSKLASLVLLTTTTSAAAADGAPESADSFASIARTLKSNKEILHEFPAEGNSELASVHAAHYEAAMHYYKRIGPPEAFYEQALSYLQHIGPNFLSSAGGGSGGGGAGQSLMMITPHQLAVDLILAALTGDGVYNLGQVEQTPVLKLLVDTPHAWLVHLLQATAAGNVQLFRQYQQEYAAQIAQQPALVHRAAAVTEKLTLLSLVTLLFSKPAHERQLSFAEIASTLLLDNLDQVEWIVMRALSVHLIEGSIDQVAQTVDVTWVMPRVLNNDQMQQLANRFGEWAVTVSKTQASVTAAIA
ncbi:hypothetical protein ACA910_000717 [Epithemia clementina (nom. ined.)]